jgi:hypothetical protein
MQYWVSLSEIIRNIGLVIGGVIGFYLARKRVVASNKQADAQLRQAELSRLDQVAELSIGLSASCRMKSSKFGLVPF